MIRGTDSSANAVTPRSASASTPAWSDERLEKGDQQLARAEPLTLVGRRLPHLDDAVRLPRIAERRAGLAVRVVGEGGGIPGASLDDELEACRSELPDGLRDERDPALALRRLARNADPHPANSLRTVTHFFTHHGLPLLFAVVMLESFGIPLPGETALIAFGVLASQGHYSIVVVIAVAAAAAIIGDNLGYELIGRHGGRRALRALGAVAPARRAHPAADGAS